MMAKRQRRLSYRGFSLEKLLARMKKAGLWDKENDEPDLKAFRLAFVRANDEIRDPRTFKNWVTGETEPKASDFGFIANALECSTDDLLNRE